ncbi:HNH endonuclease [Paraglaciecola sp. 2405UD69-4]|uniref:HNH endonuclease n=1 Tax=Paraglaciecola sp. 2405UD69-4 TaxID=3391836 RepID=UPI0039C8DF54
MPFPKKIREEALVKSNRFCCVCHEFAGRSVNVHHIIQEADGGLNELSNAIVLCLRCHAEAGHFNSRHPMGTKYSTSELVKHRDAWWKSCVNGTAKLNTSIVADTKRIFTAQDLHKHKLLISIINGNEKVISNWKLDILIPEAIEVINSKIKLIDNIEQEHLRYKKFQVKGVESIFPGEEFKVLDLDKTTLEYHIDYRIYNMRDDFQLKIIWAFYSDAESAIKGELDWDSIQQF